MLRRRASAVSWRPRVVTSRFTYLNYTIKCSTEFTWQSFILCIDSYSLVCFAITVVLVEVSSFQLGSLVMKYAG